MLLGRYLKRGGIRSIFFRIGNHKISNNKCSTVSEVKRRARDYKKDRVEKKKTQKAKQKKIIFKIHSWKAQKKMSQREREEEREKNNIETEKQTTIKYKWKK